MEISPDLNPDQIFGTIYQPGFNFMNIRGAGLITVDEFERFKTALSDLIQSLGRMGDRESNIKYVEVVLINFFTSLPENLYEQIDLLFDENNKLKLFRLLEYLIQVNVILSERDRKVFELCYTVNYNQNLSVASISNEYDLTDERIRQIKRNIEKNIQSYFSFVSSFPQDILINYGIDNESNFYVIDDIFSNQINVEERVSFNPAFYGVILGIFVKNSHVVLDNTQVIVGEKRGQKRYKNSYFIKKEVSNYFHFTPFLRGIFLIKQMRRQKDMYFELEALLISYLISVDSRAYIDDILTICRTLILKELDLFVDQYGYVRFERNNRMSLSDYAQEIFEEVMHPLTIEQLIAAINNKNPNTVTSSDSLRSCLNRKKDRFIYFSRASKYGLRNW